MSVTASTLQARYPKDWQTWSPARRRGEVKLNKALARAHDRREATRKKAAAILREADERYRADEAAAFLAYAEGNE